MKKFLVLVLIMFTMPVLSVKAESSYSNLNSVKEKVDTIGQKILTGNKLPKEVSFNIVESEEVNAYADSESNIVVYTGILKIVEKDDELAGIMSHEIGHIMKSHCYKQTFFNILLNIATSSVKNEKAAAGAQIASGLASNKVSRVQEYDADFTGADLMYKAGYNPLGLVSALNKISSNYVDVFSDHPSGSKRLMTLYDYINYNYPDAVNKGYDTQSYKNFLAYAQSALDKRNSSEKEQAKYLKTQKKLKAKRDKAAKKMMRTNDPWSMGYSALMIMSGEAQ